MNGLCLGNVMSYSMEYVLSKAERVCLQELYETSDSIWK